MKAIWCGDDEILPSGSEVEILASGPEGRRGIDVPARTACWVRYWPSKEEAPMYRSCDLADLEMSDETFGLLSTPIKWGGTLPAGTVITGNEFHSAKPVRKPGLHRDGKFITDDTDAANSLSLNGGVISGELVGAIIEDGKITRFMTQDEMERNFPLL